MKKKFEINTSLYSENLIKDAIIDFEEYIKIEYNNWILSINWESNEDIDEIFNEFMNYIIWLYNEQ